MLKYQKASSLLKSSGSVNWKTQRQVYHYLAALFSDVILEYPSLDLLFAKTGKLMRLDIFIPSLALAIEYLQETAW